MTKEEQNSSEKQEYEWIDDAFRVEQQRWGTWTSYNKEGKGLVTSITREAVVSGTRFYLKGVQEGWPEDSSRSYEGTVGGKL